MLIVDRRGLYITGSIAFALFCGIFISEAGMKPVLFRCVEYPRADGCGSPVPVF